MGAVKLELHCPNNIQGVTLDPKPDWSLDDLISELNSLELKLNASSTTPIFTKIQSRELSNAKRRGRSPKSFVMRISDDEAEDSESDDATKQLTMVVGKRFSCNEIYASDTDSSEDELALEEPEVCLMDQVGLLQGFLSEREYEQQQGVTERVRNTISQLEIEVMYENEESTSALLQIDKYAEVRREMDRRLDTNYRRKIAEALDNHLVAVQRNHEQKSQIEERKIRNDAAFEEAKRKERALQEEKAWQEKAAAEAAIRRVEEAKQAALETERIAKEAAEKKATESAKTISTEVTQVALKVPDGGAHPKDSETNTEKSGVNKVLTGNVKASENALVKEAERLQKYKELDEKNQSSKSTPNKDIRRYELQISRHIRQISGTTESVRSKATELVKIINDPHRYSIGIAAFAKTVVSQCETLSANFDSAAYACGQVIVLVTSQVPLAMDLILAEFHRACIYTVPKHVIKSKSTTNKDYLKMLGYREDEDKIENTEQFLERVESYMKLYGALVQTEVYGVQNLHGLKEGWAWLARLLNYLPINIYTAVALEAFLKMAGFSLYKKYKSQFQKVLNQISNNFLRVLEARKDPMLNRIIMKIKTYLETKQFLVEPEGWRLQTTLLSAKEPEAETYQRPNQYHRQQNTWSYDY